MTAKETANAVVKKMWFGYFHSRGETEQELWLQSEAMVESAILAAVAAERERCAKVAETTGHSRCSELPYNEQIAAAIRGASA